MATTTTSRIDIHPFSILPEDVWLMVLKRVRNHETLQNLVNAEEHFATVLTEMLPITKFIQEFPLEFAHQNTMGIDISSLLDKNWCKAVSNFLQQNLPEFSSHFSAGSLVRTEIVPTMAFNYLMRRNHMETQLCSTVEEITQFHLKLKENGEKSSQGPLSPVKLSHEDDNPEFYFDACIALFSDYGYLFESVSLDVRTRFTEDSEKMQELFQEIANSLQFLPKVEMLSIYIILDDSSHFKRNRIPTIQFPLLTCLKHLEISSPTTPSEHEAGVQKYLLDCFIKSGYFRTGQIKTLTLLTVTHDSVNEERFKAFVKHKIHELQNPQNLNDLFRFLFTQEKESIFVKPKNSIGDVFSWLTGMQLATEELHIDTSAHARFCSISENIPPQPTVHYLKLTGNLFIGLEFLTAMPSLEYLHVQYHQSSLNVKVPRQYRLSVVLSYYLYGEDIPGNCNIWNELPTLKLLIVEHVDNPEKPTFKHFVRDYRNTPVVFTQKNE